MGKVLNVATCQFAITSSIRRNAAQILRHIHAAADQDAHIVHFSEAALTGYAGQEYETWDGFEWDTLRHETECIRRAARECHMWVVLGSAHCLQAGHLPHNCLYVIDPRGRIVERYDKRFCTGGDLRYYSPGSHFSVFGVRGVVCGLLICYDVRFPELYRRYKQLGVQCMFHSFWNARAQGHNIHTDIMRPSLQTRAATNYLWISANNSSAHYQSWPSVFITPDGRIARSLKQHRCGLMVNTVDLGTKYYDAAGPYRERAMRGVLHSGRRVRDPRSDDRTTH